ncbi:hypothetical protein CCACVL1_20027 [Corchorus capsularis]|uniref:RNase H type-1 domain-containing protein n=1 Tax=Corchorus capsularis TaxID=210143 RepID=A0A1R3HD38_COCAP|nr:hypothetical protein CCACVL1_20027 [Corchorus capsularis]
MPLALCTMAARLASEVESSQQRRSSRSGTRPIPNWTPSPSGRVKVNVDASFRAAPHEIGLGVAIRDSVGTVLIPAVSRINRVFDSLFTEAYAIRFGLLLALQFGFVSCEVESDSLLWRIHA